MENVNYSHTIKNSHFWTDLDQLLRFMTYENPTTEFLSIGLKNTLKEDYDLVQKYQTIHKTTPYFLNVSTMIIFVNDRNNV